MQANQLVATGSAKDEYTARAGFTTGIYLKRLATLFWGLTAIFLVILYNNHLSNPDYLWGVASRELLGTLGIGLVGLMVSALLAAMMSTATALMLTTTSLLTHNLVRPFLSNLKEKVYVRIGAVLGNFVIVGSVLIAKQFDNIFQLLKLIWEFYIVMAGAFWLGVKWRRANLAGAWTSTISTAVLFIFLQVMIPWIPGIKTNPNLLKTTESKKITKTYTAREVDVIERNKEIALWNDLTDKGIINEDKPEPIIEGQKFQKIYKTPEKSVFWTQDIKINENGEQYGSGMLSLELVFLQRIGFDLTKNPQALNETIRLGIRTIWPFLILIIIAYFTKADDKKRLDRFFAKMKTPALSDKEEDARQIQLSFDNPDRFNYKKMFPNSNWEFEKLDKTDIKGIIWTVLGGGLIFLLLYLISFLGK